MSDSTGEVGVTVIRGDTARPVESRKQRHTKLRRIFISLALLSIIINLDGGAVPAANLHIKRTFDLTITEEGLVGMLVYQGIALGCLTVGPLLRVVSPLRASQVTLVLNTAATFLFGSSQSTGTLLLFRILIGFLQAVPAVYFPVWVDEFAPADAATIWMAVIQVRPWQRNTPARAARGAHPPNGMWAAGARTWLAHCIRSYSTRCCMHARAPHLARMEGA